MSFGYGVSDILGLTQLAWKVVDNCRRACGEHDGLTREVRNLHSVLQRLEQEAAKSDSFLNRDESRRKELEDSIEDCRRPLRVLTSVVEKYNALSEDERGVKRPWSKIKFGNGEMLDLSELRMKLLTSTSKITLHLNLITTDSQGRMEKQLNENFPEIRRSLHEIVAKLSIGQKGSALTKYSGDEKAVWKELRRELVGEGCDSSLIRRHKHVIMSYIKELGERGVLDEPQPLDPSSSNAYPEQFFGSELVTEEGELPSYQFATSEQDRAVEGTKRVARTRNKQEQGRADEQIRNGHEQIRREHELISKEHEHIKKEHDLVSRTHEQVRNDHEKIRKEHELIRKEQEHIGREHESIKNAHEQRKRGLEQLGTAELDTVQIAP